MTPILDCHLGWDLIDCHRDCLSESERQAAYMNLGAGDDRQAILVILAAIAREQEALAVPLARRVAKWIEVHDCDQARSLPLLVVGRQPGPPTSR